LPADRDVGIGGIRGPEGGLLDFGLHRGQLGGDVVDPRAGRDRFDLEIRHLGAIGPGTALDRLADALARGVPFRLERVAFAEEHAATRVQVDDAIDDGRVLTLVDRALADRVSVVAEPLQPDAHAATPDAAASRRRVVTNEGSGDAATHPARGLFVRPRIAAYSAATACPFGSPVSPATVKIRFCHASPLAGGVAVDHAASASAARERRWRATPGRTR